MSKKLFWAIFPIAIFFISIGTGLIVYRYFFADQKSISLNLVKESPAPTPLPLVKYTIPNLVNFTYQASPITIEEKIAENEDFTVYLFSYLSQGKKITGQLNVPSGKINGVIVMIRGYVPAEIYSTGAGTRSAAGVLAEHGYLTLAPDFLGFGGSDPEPADSWEARFIKPINVIELIKSIELGDWQTNQVESKIDIWNLDLDHFQFDVDQIGIWSHSNGGQIALTVLEILKQPIPATLWAPVTAPFPYSVMFYSDEVEDEGKEMRKYVSLFERDYNSFDFSLTQHLDLLTGPLLLHQGTDDDAVPFSWSDEFADKIETENNGREKPTKELKTATESARIEEIEKQILTPIDLTYYRYPGSDHNMSGAWETVINRDLDFFDKQLPRKQK